MSDNIFLKGENVMAEHPNDQTPKENSSPQISDMIDKLLSNPELISTVASALGKAAPKAESAPAEDNSKAAEAPAELPVSDIVSDIAPVLARLKGSGFKGGSDPRQDRRACLLSALKPYLCKERCDAIDYIIRLGVISELFKNLS